MPIYDYRCSECNLEMEKRIPISEMDSEFFCPDCSSKLERQVSRTAEPVFKGSDWTPKHYRK